MDTGKAEAQSGMSQKQIQVVDRTMSMMAFAFSLVMLLTLVRLSSSLFLPALPLMGRDLQLSDQVLTSLVTVYFCIYALGGLVAGPLSDARGRQGIVFGGSLICLLGTVVCIFAQGAWILLGGRVLQALGGSAIPVTSRAMIRDACDDRQTISVLGWMGVFNSVMPMLAPVLGGLITQHLGWRANFSLLAVLTLAIILYAIRFVPETLSQDRRVVLDLGTTLGLYLKMMISPAFLLVTLPLVLCFILQGAYLAVAPFLFIRQLKVSPVVFGLTGIILVMGLVIGRYVCVALLKVLSASSTFIVGGVLACAGGLSFILVVALNMVSVWGALIPSVLFCIGFGCLMPIGMKAVLTLYQDTGGTVSALHTSLTLGSSALGSALSGAMLSAGYHEMFILCVTTAGCGVLILLSCLCSRRHVT